MLIISIIKVILILALFIYVLRRKDKDYLLKIAFLFTFVSDVILALSANIDVYYSNYDFLLPLGTMIFCCAQLAYFARHCPRKNIALIFIPLAGLAIITIYTLTQTFITPSCWHPGRISCAALARPVIEPETALTYYALIYAVTEIFNFIFTFKQDRRTALGFALFIACDLIIALGFVRIIPTEVSDWLCWIFYLPAQILLAISPKPMLK